MRLGAVVTVVWVLTLGGVNGRTAEETQGVEPWRLPSPHARASSDAEIYPPEAISRGIEGRVLAAFDITTDGKAVSITILWAEDPLLAEATRHALATYHFDVPADWAQNGVRRRWRMGFVYCLTPSDQPDEFALPVNVATIRAPRTGAQPVARHPGEHRSSPCKA
jgi:hypothetical protein